MMNQYLVSQQYNALHSENDATAMKFLYLFGCLIFVQISCKRSIIRSDTLVFLPNHLLNFLGQSNSKMPASSKVLLCSQIDYTLPFCVTSWFATMFKKCFTSVTWIVYASSILATSHLRKITWLISLRHFYHNTMVILNHCTW